jgi:hypothetical protein
MSRSSLIVFLVSFFLFCAIESAKAQRGDFPARNMGFDYRASVGSRSVPAGGAMYAEAGWSQPLWGDWEESDEFLYGYIRPSLRGIAAFTVNSIDARVSVFPISFLGLTVGQSLTARASRKVMDVNCQQVSCSGLIDGSFAIVDLSLGAGGVFLVSQLDISSYRPERSGQLFYEDGGALLAAAEGDVVVYQSHVVGLSLGNRWLKNQFIGLGFSRSEAQKQGSSSERFNVTAGHTTGSVKWLYALGSYRSDLRGSSPFAGLVVEWVGRNGLRLN